MARLIDADVLIGKLSSIVDCCRENLKVNGLAAMFEVLDAIMDCKTVDDVEVVRCKDCRYYKQETKGDCFRCNVFTGSYELGFPTEEDDFCSYGERKEE